MNFSRIAGVAGLVFSGLVLAVNVVLGASGRPIEAAAPMADVASWFAEHGIVVDLIAAAAPFIWIAMTVFGVGILMATRSESGSLNPWAVVGLVGVTMQHAIFSQVIGTDTVLAAQSDAGTTLAETVWQLHHASFSLNHVSITLALGGFALAAIGSGLAPAWTQWVAGVGVAGLLLNAMQTPLLLRGAGVTALGAVGFLGWVVFAVTVALRLLRTEVPITRRPRRG